MSQPLVRKIDPKYSIEVRDGKIEIVNLAGVPIPEDEPVILFRARDRHALQMLHDYRAACVQDNCTDFHLCGIENRINAFVAFKEAHPERMKQPGITEGK